jgi:hypothetical protein
MTLKLLVVSIFRRRIIQRFFLRVPHLTALPPKSASRTRFQIFGFPLNKSQVVIDRIKNESAYGQLYDHPWARHIRLIRLLPSKHYEAHIHCEILRASLNRHPEYEALSYAWGDSKVTSPVYLEGVRSHVTTNLEQALRHLRYEDRERILWVDALSINQWDVRERNSQVKKMRSIYMGAKRVLVWLGLEEDAKVALDFCKELQRIRRMEVSEVYGEASLVETEHAYDPWAVWSQFEKDELKWKACEALFTGRPWWSRTWIIQEVLHGARVDFHMGKIVASLGELQGRYRMYMTMKARADRADISYSIDTQLDRAIAFALTEEERRSGQREGRSQLGKEQSEDRNSGRDTVSSEKTSNISLRAAAVEHEDLSAASSKVINHETGSKEALQSREVALLFDSSFRYFKGLNSTVSLSLIAEARETIGPGKGIISWDGPSKSYPLAELLRMFRGQQASDPRDKVYAFIGMASDSCGIPIDYKCSKRAVYIRTARSLRLHSGLLSVLLAVESPDRPVASGPVLPSWVPDWTTKQMLVPRFIEELASEFSANRGLSVTDVNYSSPSPSPNILVIKGLFVGVVTGTHITPLLRDGDADDRIKLIRYDRNPQKRHNLSPSQLEPWPASDASEAVDLSNTSWGPWWAEVGDIIVVAAGSTVPLVLRPVSNSNASSQNGSASPNSLGQLARYLLVGSCVLIDAQLRTLGLAEKLSDEPGFSRIMFGSAWEKVSGTDVLNEGVLEEFWLI